MGGGLGGGGLGGGDGGVGGGGGVGGTGTKARIVADVLGVPKSVISTVPLITTIPLPALRPNDVTDSRPDPLPVDAVLPATVNTL